MARPPSPRPTDGELAILRVLWRRGQSTVAQVRDELTGSGTGISVQATRTRLEIMMERGLVRRSIRDGVQVFQAVPSERTTAQQMLRDLIARLFGGSAKDLVMHALDAKKSTTKEIEEIRRKLDELDRGR